MSTADDRYVPMLRWVKRACFAGFFLGFAFATLLLVIFEPQLRPSKDFFTICFGFLGISLGLATFFGWRAHQSRRENQVPHTGLWLLSRLARNQ